MRYVVLLLVCLSFNATAAETKPEQAVAALWRAMSNDPGGQADVAALTRIFHKDAVVFGASYQKDEPRMRRTSAQDFLKSMEGVNEKGFYECEVTRKIEVYDRFAVAYSVVESRADKASVKPDFTGVNSIQLYQVGTQWQIVSLYYQVEKAGVPIPLGNGQSGKCLA